MKWRKQEKQATDTHALEAIHGFPGNILVIESEKDDRIPHETILNYMNAMKDISHLTHILVPNAPHSIKEGEFRDAVERILVQWFGTRPS